MLVYVLDYMHVELGYWLYILLWFGHELSIKRELIKFWVD